MTHPFTVTVPMPVYIVPLQQKRYSPLTELKMIAVPLLESSSIQTSKTVTVKLQIAVLPDASVAVQLTVVVPTGKVEPDGGLQSTLVPGQLSVAMGAG